MFRKGALIAVLSVALLAVLAVPIKADLELSDQQGQTTVSEDAGQTSPSLSDQTGQTTESTPALELSNQQGETTQSEPIKSHPQSATAQPAPQAPVSQPVQPQAVSMPQTIIQPSQPASQAVMPVQSTPQTSVIQTPVVNRTPQVVVAPVVQTPPAPTPQGNTTVSVSQTNNQTQNASPVISNSNSNTILAGAMAPAQPLQPTVYSAPVAVQAAPPAQLPNTGPSPILFGLPPLIALGFKLRKFGSVALTSREKSYTSLLEDRIFRKSLAS